MCRVRLQENISLHHNCECKILKEKENNKFETEHNFASNKAKLFVKNFPKNSNLDDSGIYLPVFPSRTNLKLHNISVTPILAELFSKFSLVVFVAWFQMGR